MVKRLLSSLPKLKALAPGISGMSGSEVLDIVIQSQPQIRQLYLEYFPRNEDMERLIRLPSVRIFAMIMPIKTRNEQAALSFLRNPFLHQLTHLRTVNLFCEYCQAVGYPGSVEQEIRNLMNGNLKHFDETRGFLWDDFITQMPQVMD